MKTLKNYLIVLCSLFVISCEKVIDVDLETEAPRLVIDASIDWIKNTSGNEQRIKLSTTTAYYSEQFPTVSGADITIANSTNTTFHFIENPGTGEYICTNFQPVIGETYSLKVILNGETYTATETLISVPNIEGNIEQNNTGGMAGDEIEITYRYQDDPAQQNYYLTSVKNPRVAFPEYAMLDDENNQGNLVPVDYSNEDLKSGDILDIRLYGISRRHFDYFGKLLSVSADSPFPTVPSAVRGNIVNQTNFSNYAFGYFRLSEVDVKSYTVQ